MCLRCFFLVFLALLSISFPSFPSFCFMLTSLYIVFCCWQLRVCFPLIAHIVNWKPYSTHIYINNHLLNPLTRITSTRRNRNTLQFSMRKENLFRKTLKSPLQLPIVLFWLAATRFVFKWGTSHTHMPEIPRPIIKGHHFGIGFKFLGKLKIWSLSFDWFDRPENIREYRALTAIVNGSYCTLNGYFGLE